ncbi:LytR/AlgR family response regulator transcription factor [Aliidiomarina celeris]|uniref:LytR/AlgR family response regulator transcription factor n=1 Tax=Aliidiomarina celeris TaxID=2249428 RepID=UPI000DEB00BB|nr:LytTR family DNA-binding domain-containing protein [Aliidiomarina celeris]
MYNVVIIEDEPLARQKLVRMLRNLASDIKVVAELESVMAVRTWLQSRAHNTQRPDVIFSDIELLDGNVFEAYQDLTLPCPIIFTTAYDAYFLPAFETHGIAYLLKPYSEEKLAQAWQKFTQLTQTNTVNPLAQLEQLLTVARVRQAEEEWPQRFAIKQQQHTYFLNVDRIHYVKADAGLVMAFDENNQRHYLPFTSLQAAEKALDPKRFFRINRSELVCGARVEKLERYNKNTLALYLPNGVQLKTSESRTAEFGQWIGLGRLS